MAVDVASLVIRVSSLEAQSAARDLDRLSGASARTDRAARQMSGGFASVGSALKGMVAQLAAVAGVAALAQSFMAANTAAGMLRASLTTVTGSLETATKAWGALQNFAAQTPFSLEQSVQAFIKLKAMGLDPSQRALMSYGNTASAMGKNINQMIEAVADAATGEFERLKEFGIKAKVEGDSVAMTFQGVTTKIGNSAKDIEGYLMKIGETQFAGAMEAQAKTLGGALSNIGDAWDQLMVTLGDTGATDAIGESIAKISGLLTDLSASLEEGMPVGELGAQLAELEAATGGWGEAIAGIGPAWQEVFNQLAEMPNYVISIRDGALAIEEQGTAWDAVKELVIAFGEAMIALPDNLQKAVYIMLGEIDILVVNFETGMNTLPLYAKSAWDHIQNIILTAWVNIKIAVAEAVAWIAGQLAGMATKMAGFFASVPEEFDIGGVAASSAAQLNGLAASLNTTKVAVTELKAEKVALGQTIVDNNGKLQAEIQTVQASGAAQVSAIRDTIQAGIADVDSKNQRRKAQAGVNSELAIAVGEEAKLNKQFDLGKAGQAAHTQATHAGAAAHKGAAKAANEQEKALDALIKKYLPARDDAKNLEEATAVLDKAMQDGKITGEEYGKMLKGLKKDYNSVENAAQALIDKYDTEGARTRQLAEDRALMAANMADGNLKLEGAAAAMDKLTEAEKKNTKEADAWAEVWKNAVKRIDDTFASLWKDLFSGTKSTLESMKNAILSWLAEVAHALLTKPLVVAITTAMTGGTSVAGAAGQAASGVSGLSSFSSIGSMFSTAFQLGSTFLSGVAEGVMGMFSTNMFSTIGTAWGAATSGSAMGAAAGAGVIAAYALPLVAAGALILNKYFKDQEPRYGAYGATTTGRTDQFEDGVGVKGGFGLTFGMNDMGTANVDAEEMRGVFEGFAKVSQALADFYGKDVEAAVQASLAKASMENWGKNGLMNYAMSAEQAFQIAFTDIIKHAAATGDAVAVVMSSVVGSLQGTLEQMADQIERGMMAAKAVVGMAEAFQGQEMGDRLGLADKDTVGNALKLIEYANNMKEAGETTAEAMGRMALNLIVLDGALTLTGTKTDATGMAFVELANSLAKAADDAGIGMEGLAQLQAAYYQNFFSEEERALKQKEDATKAIKRWNADQGLTGKSEIKDSAGLRKYIEGLDLTTEAGQKAYVSAMQIVGAFIGLDDALKALGESTLSTADKVKNLDDLIKKLDPTRDTSQQDSANKAKAELDKYGYKGDYSGASIAAFLAKLKEFSNGLEIGGEDLEKFTDGLLALAEIAAKKADMEATIIGLTKGPEAEQAARRKMELAAMEASLRPLQERIWKLQDEAKAAQAMTDLQDWLTDGAYSAAAAQARVADAFKRMGIEMPATKDALIALYNSGKLTAEQMKILAGILGDLKVVYPDPKDAEEARKNENRGSANSGGGSSETQRQSKIPELELKLLTLLEGAWAGTLKQRETELAALTEEEAILQKQIWALEDAARVRTLEVQLLEAQGKSWEATLAQRELELKALSEEEQAIQQLIWAQEDANALRDLEWQLMEAQGYSWAVTLAKREQELLGLSEEQQALQKLIWAQEDANRVRSLEIELLEAQGHSWEATLAKRELELQSLSEEEQALQQLIWAQEDANKIRDLNIQLLEAQGRSEEALQAQRELQLLSMSEEEQAIQKTIWALQDEKAIREEQLNLQIRLAEAMGNNAIAVQIRRQMELAAVTNSASRALLLMIYAIENQKSALNANNSSNTNGATGGGGGSSSSSSSSSADSELVKALEKLVSSLDKLSSSIQSTIKDLFPQEQVDIIMRRELAESKIRAALIAARAGNIPTYEDLKDALNAVGKTEDKQFQTREDYLRRMGQTKNELTELDRYVQEKLTTEEKILETLKAAPGATGDSVGESVNPVIEETNGNIEQLITLSGLMVDAMDAIDANFNDNITYEEMVAALGHVASEESLLAYFNTLDTNQDGVISAIESLPLSIAISLKPMFDELDENGDGQLTYNELTTALGSVMSSAQIQTMISLMDTDQNGTISELEASNFNLSAINAKSDELEALTSLNNNMSYYLQGVNGGVYTTNQNLNNVISKLDTANTTLTGISSYSIYIYYSINTSNSYLSTIASNTSGLSNNLSTTLQNTNDILYKLTMAGYATGGIASGPTSGYQATLHGTEAIIPLGDGNSVTAHLTAPLPNYIAQEAGDGPELRQALAELQAEIAALRGDQRAIGAATVGELKDHNKRERKRDVVPQVVEIAP